MGTSLANLLVIIFGWSLVALPIASDKYSIARINVLDYGAVGDGNHDDSHAFIRAWEDFCSVDARSAVFHIPRDRLYLLKPVRFRGPCRANKLDFQIYGDLVAPKMEDWDDSNKGGVWILISDVDGLVVYGNGQVDGQGGDWWEKKGSRDDERPKAVAFHDCNYLQVNGLKIVDTPRSHLSVNGCNNSTLSLLNFTAPANSPNTDGIDISHSTNVTIRDSFIGTGDDCIAINGGCSNINITSISCGPGHGISVGSLGGNGQYDTVEAINVTNCNFTGTTNGVRIKTWPGGSGYARNITFENIRFESVKNPIIIDQFYFSSGVKNQAKAVNVSNITYKNISGSSLSDNGITLKCSDKVPCTGIVMDQVNITLKASDRRHRHGIFSDCMNVKGYSTATFPPVHCLEEY